MLVFIDGKKYKVRNDVKILYDNQDFVIGDVGKEQEVNGHLQLTATHEGIIADLFGPSGVGIFVTQSLEQQDIVDMLK